MLITIGFSKPKTFFKPFSWAIRLVQWTEYSHVYVKWTSKSTGIDLIYQASGTSVNFMAKRIFDTHAVVVKEFELDITDETFNKLLRYCLNNAGVDYGFKSVFGIALVKLGICKKNPYTDGDSSYVCSELVGQILKNIFEYDLNINLDIADPKDIYNFLEQGK